MSYKKEYATLFRLGMPVMATQLGIIMVAFADTAMVGAYGVNELAAAAFVNSMFMVPVVMQIGFASGITPLIGALFGRKDPEGAGRTLRAGLQVNSFVSIGLIVLMGLLYFFLDKFGQPDELLPLIQDYYLIILASMFPMAIFNCSQQTANAVNDTATPMWIILGANLLNILGNYVLIFGKFGFAELGLNGAGLSTLVARWLTAVWILLIFASTKRYRPYFKGAIDSHKVGNVRVQVWTISWPMMIQSGVECGLWTLGAIVTGWFGKIQLAAYQVINTISQLGFMTFMSFGIAVSIRSANYSGTGNVAGVRRITVAGLHLNMILAAIASLVFILFGNELIGFFSPDKDVLASAHALLLPLVVYQFGDSIQLTLANGLRGTGNAKPFLWVALIAYILIGVPAMFWLAVGLDKGNVGVYYSFSFALFSAAILLYIFFKKTLSTKI